MRYSDWSRIVCRLSVLSRACIPLLLGISLGGTSWAQLPTNNDPNNQIRFDTPAQADAARANLVNYIWDGGPIGSGGLPTTLPSVTTNVAFPSQADGIDQWNVASVDQLDVNVSGYDFHSISYLMHPTNLTNADRVIIVHQGHADDLDLGVGATANDLLQNGFTVLVMKMPLYGWNTDNTAIVPNRGVLVYSDHDSMISSTGGGTGGEGFRLFLEPVVQNINYVSATIPGFKDVNMVGLSGGGWTTSMMAAVDPRIKVSVPVAGSAPLYARNADPPSMGDLEQNYAPMYNENIAPDRTGGGVATWLETYALGGYGAGRSQVMVTNEFDDCCFSGTFATTLYGGFTNVVANKVTSLGAGQWSYVLDSTANTHQISSDAISSVINPALGITSPAPPPNGLPINHQFNDQSFGIPNGWTADPANQGTIIESGGEVVLSGTSIASMVRSKRFDPQIHTPVTITMRLDSVSLDNYAGFYVTNDASTRAHYFAPLINTVTKEIIIWADNRSLNLGALPSYMGGAATFSLTFDDTGFSLVFDAEAQGKFSSARQLWSAISGTFDLATLGYAAQVLIQSYDLDSLLPASMRVDYLTFLVDGDANGNNVLNNFDIQPFELALTDPAEFLDQFPAVTDYAQRLDVNHDGSFNNFDIQPFERLLTTAPSAPAAAVPEPSSLALAAIAALGSLAWLARRRR